MPFFSDLNPDPGSKNKPTGIDHAKAKTSSGTVRTGKL